VWEALKEELLPVPVAFLSTSLESQEVETVKEALSCLSNWVLAFQIEKYSSQVFMNDSEIMETGDFLRLILQDRLVEGLFLYLEDFPGGQGHTELALKDRSKHLAKAAGLVLAEAARACPSSCFVICRQVLPRLMAGTGLMAEEISSTGECIVPGSNVRVIFPSEIPLVMLSQHH